MTLQSYERKLIRAEKHLIDIESRIAKFEAMKPYTVRREIQGNKRKTYVYRLHFRAQPDEDLPLIIGDFLNNVRTALDYLTVGMAPSRNRRNVHFPLFERDLWPADLSSITDAEALKRDLADWELLTKGMKDGAIATLKKHMPNQNIVPAKHFNVLGMLRYLSNADKHRNMPVLEPAVRNFKFWYTDPTSGRPKYGSIEPGKLAKDDTQLVTTRGARVREAQRHHGSTNPRQRGTATATRTRRCCLPQADARPHPNRGSARPSPVPADDLLGHHLAKEGSSEPGRRQ